MFKSYFWKACRHAKDAKPICLEKLHELPADVEQISGNQKRLPNEQKNFT